MSDPVPQGLEEQRVFAAVARSMFGQSPPRPTIGRFELRGRLGSGAMGEVFSAYDPKAQRTVAVKVLAADRRNDQAAIGRFGREAAALIKVRHPHVVDVYEVGEDGERLYIAMEQLRGESLESMLRRERQLDHTQVQAIVGGVCAALAHTHSLAIVHRDLKPANIFVCQSANGPVAKLLDFGIAKGLSTATLGGTTASGTVLGTPYYMSPEQARDSSKVDARADLWATAVVTYECVVGRRPFDATNLPDLAVQILTQKPPVPSEHGTVPPGFDAWFARATHANPERRFASARQLGDALVEALQPRALRGPWRRRSLWVAAGLGVVGVTWWGATRAPPRPSSTPTNSPPAATIRESVHSPEFPKAVSPSSPSNPKAPLRPTPAETNVASEPAPAATRPRRRPRPPSSPPRDDVDNLEDLEF
ncbi:MAG: protein kinase [Nannocystaceae bacterium]|nr:protein kinase [Nannocystaceae bacterium]